MSDHKWKKCQACGAVAVAKGERVSCPDCDDPWTDKLRWDSDQNVMRAKKRFELVNSIIGGTLASGNTSDAGMYLKLADVILDDMYGKVPGDKS